MADKYTITNVFAAIKVNPTAVGNVFGENGDTTSRLSLSTWQQSSQNEPFGDLIRFILEHCSAKGGLKMFRRGAPAQVISTNSSPFAVTTGQTLILSINGNSQITITFNSITSGAATASEISDAICKQVNYTSYPSGEKTPSEVCQSYQETIQTGTTVPENGLRVAIESGAYGIASSVEIVGGTARAALGFSIGTTLGADGTVDCGIDGLLQALAWIVCHDHPNNLASNNKHKHISFEVIDALGEMQTRLSIAYGKNVAEILISSAMLILDGYPLTVSNSANSNKDINLSRGNTGMPIERVWQMRAEADSSGGDLAFNGFSDAGVATKLLLLNRLGKYISVDGAIQQKLRATANNSATTMTLTPQNGNHFVIALTNSISYITTTDWKPGSVITLRLQGAASLVNQAGSPSGTSAALLLRSSTNFTSGANGSTHTFKYQGGYTNLWEEIGREAY